MNYSNYMYNEVNEHEFFKEMVYIKLHIINSNVYS